ncbi:hypothetical protein MRB53_013884 [Persea americana]|uniref:Uncharacterized protein n=1 Tax=Persea americana TaxID=3435 RepID=A0ACC2K9W2_PERAE|nr:hypothetical protein MRB53_013884 [Persea americana]
MQQHLYLSLPLTIAAPPSLSHRSASWLFLVRCKCENGRGKEEKGWKRSSARVLRRPGHQHPFLLQTNPSFFHLSLSFSFPTPGSISVASALFVSWPAISWNFRKGIKQDLDFKGLLLLGTLAFESLDWFAFHQDSSVICGYEFITVQLWAGEPLHFSIIVISDIIFMVELKG